MTLVHGNGCRVIMARTLSEISQGLIELFKPMQFNVTEIEFDFSDDYPEGEEFFISIDDEILLS